MSPIDCDMHDTGGLARSDPDRQSHGPLPDFQRLVAGTSRITESPFRDCGLPSQGDTGRTSHWRRRGGDTWPESATGVTFVPMSDLHAPIGYSLQGEELLELNGHRKWLRRGRPSCDGCRVDEVLSQVLRSERLLHVASTIRGCGNPISMLG